MNLAIDIGNTRAKIGVFQKKELLKTIVCLKEDFWEEKRTLQKEFPEIEHGILANVAKPEKGGNDLFSDLKGTTIVLNSKTPLPFKNQYKTPQTLGLDRVALAAAATAQFPNQNVLVIDAGTCVTYDLVAADKGYLGGAISNGLNMRYRALHDFTANLPFLQPETGKAPFVGENTQDSIHLGVKQGLLFEIDSFIDRYKAVFPDLKCVLTGGDCKILSKSLKNSIFATKNFLLSGLNCILEYNKD